MARCGGSSRAAFARLRSYPKYSRSSTTAPMAAALRSVFGSDDRLDLAERPAPSIARARQFDPQTFAGIGAIGVSVMPPWLAERTAAPPALTFVLPGKQRVNLIYPGSDLPRAVRGLPQVCRVLGEIEAPGMGSARRATFTCSLSPARSDRAGNR